MPLPPDIVFGNRERGDDRVLSELFASIASPPGYGDLEEHVRRILPLLATRSRHRAKSVIAFARPHNFIYQIKFSNEQFVVKAYGSHGDCARDVVTTRYLEGLGFDEVVPSVAHGLVHVTRSWKLAFSVFPHVEGYSLSRSPTSDHATIYEAAGQFARRLHALPTPCRPRPFSVENNHMFDIAPFVTSGVFSDHEWSQLEFCANQRLRQFGDVGDTLIHNDLGTGSNIIVTRPDGRVRIVDFELSCIAFRMLDLLWVRSDSPSCFPAFCSGYGLKDWASIEPLIALFSTMSAMLEDAGYRFLPSPGEPYGAESTLAAKSIRFSPRLKYLKYAFSRACQ